MRTQARRPKWILPLIVGGAAVGAAALALSSPARAAVPPAAPTVSLALHPSGLSVTASAITTGTVTSWAWSWGDGATSAGAPPQSHTYGSGGSYTVTVTATGPGGSGSAQGTATVAPPETAPTVALGSPQVDHLTVTLSAIAAPTTAGAAIASEAWDWGDGTTSSGPSPQSHTYGAAGTYTVTVTATDSDGLTAAASSSVTVAAPPAPAPHVFLVLMENRAASEVLAVPYFAALCAQYGCATNYSGVTRPSLPNYMALTSGGYAATSGHSDCPSNVPYTVPNLFEQMTTAGTSWAAYAEDLPPYPAAAYAPGGAAWADCGNVGEFIQHHFPATYYSAVINDPSAFAAVQNYTALLTDLKAGSAPSFSWITPNRVNDGHNGTLTNVQDWLQAFLTALQASPVWASSTVIVTWDSPGASVTLPGFLQSPETDSGGGNVLTLVISPRVTPGTVWRQQLSHYSTLAAIETAFDLPLLGYAASAPAWPELLSLIEEPVAAAAATVSDAQWSLPGVSPSVSSRGITAAAAGTGQIGFAWYRGGFALTAAPGSRFSSVTLRATDVGGTFSWDGQPAGSYAQGTAVWVLSPTATPGLWTAFGLSG